MAPRLTDDPAYRSTLFAVIDFEATTPRGYPPEPIEVAIVLTRPAETGPVEVDRYAALIRPPAHAPITPFDTDQTGLRPADVADARTAAAVLTELDTWLPAGDDCLLVAHSAPVEAGLLFRHRQHCPRLARTHLIDTVRLARAVIPGLISYGLDHLLYHLRIPRPVDRHRAMPDVEATLQLFTTLLATGQASGQLPDLATVRRLAELVPKATLPEQGALF